MIGSISTRIIRELLALAVLGFLVGLAFGFNWIEFSLLEGPQQPLLAGMEDRLGAEADGRGAQAAAGAVGDRATSHSTYVDMLGGVADAASDSSPPAGPAKESVTFATDRNPVAQPALPRENHR